MFYSPLEKDSYEEDSQILRIFFVAVLFKWAVSIGIQSKELDDESEEGFVGARYAVVRHTVALHDGNSPPEKDSYPTKEFKAKPTPGPRAKNMLQLDHVGASQPET